MAEDEKPTTAGERQGTCVMANRVPSTVSWEPDLDEDDGVRRTFEFELVKSTRLKVKVPGHDLMQAQDILQSLIGADRLMQNTDEEDCSVSHLFAKATDKVETVTYSPTGVSTVAGFNARLHLPRFILRDYGDVGRIPGHGKADGAREGGKR